MRLPWDVKPKQMDEGTNVTTQSALSFSGINPVDEGYELNKFTIPLPLDERVKVLVKELNGGLGKKSDPKVLEASFRDAAKEAS